MDEVNKDEKKDVPAKLQPTSEQLRLAQITQMADAQLDPQHRAKISQVRDKMRQTVFCFNWRKDISCNTLCRILYLIDFNMQCNAR